MNNNNTRFFNSGSEVLNWTRGQKPMRPNNRSNSFDIAFIVLRVEARDIRLRRIFHRFQHSSKMHCSDIYFGDDAIDFPNSYVLLLTPHWVDADWRAENGIGL